MKLSFISSYEPRKSGLTTYNQDFIQALDKEKFQVSGVAINASDAHESRYSSFVKFQVRLNHLEDYVAAAEMLNKSSNEIICLQHEFGQFGGKDGYHIMELIKNLKKPLVIVAHTVPVRSDAHKNASRLNFFQKANQYTKFFITFQSDAKKKLHSLGIPLYKIMVVPHAVPDLNLKRYKNNEIATLNRHNLKKTDIFLFSFGFIHKNKGTTYLVEAMKYVEKINPNIRLVIAGSTYNSLYLKELRRIIDSSDMKNTVIKDIYLNDDDLAEHINACSIGIVPYIYRSYTASGPLSFFIGAEKPIIATRFAYATSVLDNKTALFVPFKNSKKIAEAILKLSTNEQLRAQLSLNIKKIKKKLLWENIIEKYENILRKARI